MVNAQQKPEKKKRKKSRVLALILLVGYFVFFSAFIMVSLPPSLEIVFSPEQRSFKVPININLNGIKGFVDTDVTISLNLRLNKPTLTSDEPVDINGLAIFKSERTANITKIAVSFQNCMEYQKFDQWGIPEQAFLVFDNKSGAFTIDNITGKLVYFVIKNMKVNWSVDGDYKPIIGVFYNDNTNSTMTDEDVVIHVFPKEQYTQIQTNKASIILSWAVLGLSLIGVFDLFIQLWNYGLDKYNYPQTKTNETKPEPKIHNVKPESKIDEKSKSITDKPKPEPNKN
jgi:hypothetical protein